MSQIMNYLKTHKIEVIVIGLLISLVVLEHLKVPSSTLRRSEETPVVTQETSLQVIPKDSLSDPDLVLTNHYVAMVNGAKLEAPIKTTNGTQGTQTIVKQEIDVTSLVRQMTPRWEVGTGVGYHDEIYIPVSIQRNYKQGKAIEFEVHIDPKDQKVNGYELQHKWTF